MNKARKRKNSKPFPNQISPTFVLKLPWPPSINHYYGRTRTGQQFIGSKGKQFRKDVIEYLRFIPESDRSIHKDRRVQVWVEAFPPDRRRRDLDNLKKALLDSLTHAEVWQDDCQVDDLRVVRREPTKGGHVIVHVSVISHE